MTPHPDPSDALIELMAPDGYYKYLQVPKPSAGVAEAHSSPTPSASSSSSSGSGKGVSSSDAGGDQQQQKEEEKASLLHEPVPPIIDEDLVKKNYRKLSRKHHPDRPGGDADTFRLLNRAQVVLLNPKLRHQYDILGVDLNDDEVEEDHHDHVDEKDNNGGGSAAATGDNEHPKERPSTAQGIIQEIASMALSSIMQLTVRTAMMGAVAVILVRYRLLLYPALAFLAFIAFRIFQQTQADQAGFTYRGIALDFLSPVVISAGLLSMHNGRTIDGGNWTVLFWLGEATVIAAFSYNSVAAALPKTPLVWVSVFAFAVLTALWFRGSAWNYGLVIGLEVFLAVVVALAFPVVEFILETVLNDKLRKVGDKVRAHHEVLEAYYKAKIEKIKREQKKQRS